MNVTPEAVSTTAKPQSSELQGRNELFSPQRTLGYGALEANAKFALQMHEFRTSAITPWRHVELSKEIHTLGNTRKRGIDHARSVLTMYDGPKADILERYLSSINTPEISASIKQKEMIKGSPMTWKEWLTHHATDDELMQLLLEHTDVMLQHARSDEIAEDIDTLQDKFMRNAYRLREAGYLAMDPRDPSEVLLRFGDIFDTTLKDRAGYYQLQTDEVVLGQGYQTMKEGHVSEARRDLPRVILHEWAHALVGQAYREDSLGVISERWFNEGVTEELHRLVRRLYGDAIPAGEDKVYETERIFIADVAIAPSKHQAEMRKLIFRAYSGSDDDRHTLLEEVDALWKTKNVIEKISAEVSLKEGALAVSWAQAEAILKGEDQKLARPKPPTAAMQMEALQIVHKNFNEDPHMVLRKQNEALVEQMQLAAQEPKK